MKRIHALLLLGALPLLLCAERANALDIGIQVQELLPANVAPRPRPTQVVRVGVPLPANEHVRSIDELGFVGSPAAQFRVLHRDPETQDIRWVLVRFLGAPGSSVYSVTRGSGNFGGANLGVDAGTYITVETGDATFEIRKQGFRFLDAVRRGTATFVETSGRGIVVEQAGRIFCSGLDPAAEIVLEENGPLEAVVRARGRLTDSTGAFHLAYTARLYFNRNQSSCRASVTLENGKLQSLSAKTFDAAWVELPLALDDRRLVRFGTSDGVVSDSLGQGSAAHLLQGDNDFMRDGRTARIVSYLTSAQGLEIDVDHNRHARLGDTTDYAMGWMMLTDATRSVGIGMRDLAAQFPGGFVVEGAVARAELFSSHNPRTGLIFSWAAHETRELLFQFGAATEPSEDFYYALQHPLLGRCSFEHYRDSGAIFGATELVTVEEERDFFAQQGVTWNLQDLTENTIEFRRQYSFSTTGGPNQFDHDLASLLDWVRAGYTGHYTLARQGVLWKADQAVPHSDDFDYGDRALGVNDVSVSQPQTFHGKGAGSWFDDEHPHWVCMPLYYWLTGDERVRSAIEDYVEYRRFRGNNPVHGAVNGGALGHMRLWSRSFRDIALGYEFTQRQRYLDDLRRMAGAFLGTIETNGSRGRNLERGYFYFGETNDASRRIHLFFLTEMNPSGMREAMRVLPRSDPLREDLRDYLAGLAWFTLREAQISESAVGYPYGYYAAVTNTELGNRGDETGIVLDHGYRMSGDLRFAERARSFAWRVIVDSSDRRESDLPMHIRISTWNDLDQHGAVLIQPAASRNPDGTWTLQWTAPQNATEYIVKYGNRRLVENLDFDQVSRTYRIAPAANMNFWAATNLQGEPLPGSPGTPETWVTPVLPAGEWQFAVKAILRQASALAPRTQLDAGETQEDVGVTLDVLSNDADLDGSLDPTTVRIETPPRSGVATVQAGVGEIAYAPTRDFNGDEYFAYSVADDAGLRSSPTTVHVVVRPVNDPPVATDDHYVVTGETLPLHVLENDRDVDSPNLTVVEVITAGTVGDVRVSPDGRTVTYTAANDLAEDVFRYIVADGNGGLDSAAVFLEVDFAPVAVQLSDMQARNTADGILITARFEADEEVTWLRALRSQNGRAFEPVPGAPAIAPQSTLEVLDPGTGLRAGDRLVYRFEARMATGERRLLGAEAEVRYAPPTPLQYSLEQCRPNPFNPRTAIWFSLPQAGHTTLKVYDGMGRQVAVLVDEMLAPGRHGVIWEGVDDHGRKVASGTYYYRLLSGRFARTKSMRLVK